MLIYKWDEMNFMGQGKTIVAKNDWQYEAAIMQITKIYDTDVIESVMDVGVNIGQSMV